MKKTPKFSSDYNRGFSMTFENGMTISVQFGTGNYCSRRNFHDHPFTEIKEYTITSPDAEIAIWDADGNWFDFGYDRVKGYITPNEVATWIIFCTAATSMEDLKERVIACEMI